MCPLIQESRPHARQSLVEQLRGERGVVLLRSGLFGTPEARYSFLTAQPFLPLIQSLSRCEMVSAPPSCSIQQPALLDGVARRGVSTG